MVLLLSFGKEAVGEVLRCIALVVDHGLGLLGPVVVVVREREDHALRRDALVVQALLAKVFDAFLGFSYRVKESGIEFVVEQRPARGVEPDSEPGDRVGLLSLQLPPNQSAAL
jgi:hypothetical protein